jgi:predicted Zn-dependent protease
MRLHLRFLPLLTALALATPAASARAASVDDSVRQIENQYGVVDNDSGEGRRLNAQLDRVVQRVVDGIHQERGRSDFRLRSARILGGRDAKHDRVVNAFALPDGRIYVSLGLMRLIENDRQRDDELAFVVGHELTHVVEHHSASQAKRSMPASIAAILLGAATRSSAVGSIAQYGAAAYNASYSRKDEYRADKGGLLAMRAAGYDPHASVTMLQRLQEQGGSQRGGVNTWFASHPLTQNRVDRVREMIASMGNGEDIRDASDRDIDRSIRDDRNR